MNETSIVTRSTGPGQVRRLETARVEVLDDDDARIVAQRPVDLPVADVERDDPRGAALEQDVGEAAGGGADVERLASVDRNPNVSSACASLRPPRPTYGWSGAMSATSADGSICVPGLRVRLPVDADLAGEDQRARPLARRREAPFDDELIEANAKKPELVRGMSQFDLSTIQRPICRSRESARSTRCSAAAARSRQSARHRPRRLEAVERGIGRLAGRGILAGGLPQVRRRAFDIQHVVDDLKRETELRGRAIDRVDLASLPPPITAPAVADARISAPVLRACMARSPPASSGGGGEPSAVGVTHARSIAWPPTIPSAPAAADDAR